MYNEIIMDWASATFYYDWILRSLDKLSQYYYNVSVVIGNR